MSITPEPRPSALSQVDGGFPAGFCPAVTSLADTDLYKLTMLQVMLHRNPGAQASTEFFCRNTPAYPLAELAADIELQLDWLCLLRFTEQELRFIGGKPYFKSDFIDFLRLFQFQREYVSVSVQNGLLRVQAKGPLMHITGFEIHVLAIVNELYFRRADKPAALAEGRARLQAKIALLKARDLTQAHPFEFFDFGTRRRFSREWHDEVVATLAREVPEHFKGTSNVFLAMKYGLAPIGTMAHEHLQKHQGLGVQLKRFQQAALEEWVQEYRGDLGIALTDVVNMDAFLRDFDLYFAKLFDGLRHDSGDPFVWAQKAIAHYRKLRIDPSTKRLVFSDGLDFALAFALYDRFASTIQPGFGIGTWLTNDVGLVPLNVVMKLMEVNEQPVAKISDTPGKTLCGNRVFLRYLCQVYEVDTAWLDATPATA